MLEDTLDTVKKSAETLIDISKENGQEVNVVKTRYLLLYRHRLY
jgi:hypothetical protein